MKNIISKLDSSLGGKSASVLYFYCFFLTLTLGCLDYVTGTELSFSVFYVIPVAMATWYAQKSAGRGIALFSSAVWLFAELAPGNRYSLLIIPLWNLLVRLAFFLIIVELLSKIRTDLTTESNLADTDYLTGLANRRSFHEKLEDEMARAVRYRHPLTIVYFDLDNFKTVNDTRGHDTGDEVLKIIASTLKGNVRKMDVVGRLGGDEFAAFFPETGFDSATTIIKHIHPSLNEAMRTKDWPVTVSIGAVAFHEIMTRGKDMLKLADDLMYNVKKGGKNHVLIKKWPPEDGRPPFTMSIDGES